MILWTIALWSHSTANTLAFAPTNRAFFAWPTRSSVVLAPANSAWIAPPSRVVSSALWMSIPNPLDTLTSGLTSMCRMPGGVSVVDDKVEPPNSIRLKELYDVENSRDCRLVRERITELDLVVEKVIPAAANSRVFVDPTDMYALPSQTLLPRLVVESDNSNSHTIVLTGQADILDYLDRVFGSPSTPQDDSNDPKEQLIRALRDLGSYVAGAFRVGRGSKVSAAAKMDTPRPPEPLILYSYEGNQFCRLVREVLTELDLVYQLRSAGKGSPRREELMEMSGKSQCPYVIDPNTGASLLESADIIRYLYRTYALYTPPNEILQWASDVILPAAKPIFQLLAPIQAGARSSDPDEYQRQLLEAKSEIERTIKDHQVVIYTYGLSPYSTETKAVLNNLGISFREVSLGLEWIPGLIKQDGAITRAALLDMTGQSSLPHIFVNGRSIGGLFTGTPGLLKFIEGGSYLEPSSNAKATGSLPNMEDTEAFA